MQAWVTEIGAERGPVIVHTAYSVLARILDDAVRDRLVVSNPARGIKLPRRARRQNVYLTPVQLHALADESGRYRSLVLLLGVGGLRWVKPRRCGCRTSIFCAAGSSCTATRSRWYLDLRRHPQVGKEPDCGVAGVCRGCAGADRHG